MYEQLLKKRQKVDANKKGIHFKEYHYICEVMLARVGEELVINNIIIQNSQWVPKGNKLDLLLTEGETFLIGEPGEPFHPTARSSSALTPLTPHRNDVYRHANRDRPRVGDPVQHAQPQHYI